MTDTARRAAPARPAWRAVAVPVEHGGWGLTAEPVLLGLLVSPGPAGVALGVAAVVAFCARTPLRVVLVDRRRGRSLERTRLAGRVLAVEAVLLAGLVVVALAATEGPFWIPLALAVPLVVVELVYDARSRSRRLVPELAGTIGIGSVAAAIVLAGGGEAADAAGAWTVVAARAMASVPFVRLQLARAKGRPQRRWTSDLAQGLAVGVGAAGLGLGVVPVAAVAALAVLAAVQVALSRTPPPRAAVVGAQQVVLGLAVVATAALGFLAP